ncbi:MAG TPA: trypsin-like peptidase domain-containing protein [Bryobacteraceae bacterium]|nr:trypsin-like peptidase domain-containing protein [Bryobacteraceae bacterium]
MRLRTLFFAALLVGAFVYVTSKNDWTFQRFVKPAIGEGHLWKSPAVVKTAGLGPDELNNIEIYKMASKATAYITSTTYRQTWFFEVYPAKDLGSGFIIDPSGKILTNYHVISGSSQVEVSLSDQTKYKAQILVRDPQDDLALIQITPRKKLPFLHLGDSDSLQVGQKVLAIGNPFGLSGTLTTGVVSSVGRPIRGENDQELDGMIQTDAAINSGNSGGPLLDSLGNVIGINTAILGQGGNIGIGFATPINRAKTMLDDYAAGRKFGRPWLGISDVYVAGDLAQALELPASGGLLIQEVRPGSAAEDAGLRGARELEMIGNAQVGVGGDLIVGIDGHPVDNPEILTRTMGRKRPGDTLDLVIFRHGRRLNVKVKLGTAPERM